MSLPVQYTAMIAAGEQFAADLGGRLDLLTVAGSHAYGTNHAESDLDLRGVYTLPSYRFLGTEKPATGFEHLGDVLDVNLKELAEYVRLASGGNPHVLETLFVEPEDVIFVSEVGRQLIRYRSMFVTQEAAGSALGYFKGQVNYWSRMDPEHRRYMKTKGHIVRLSFAFTHLVDTGTVLVRLSEDQKNYITHMKAEPDDGFLAWAFAMVEIFHNVSLAGLRRDVLEGWANEFTINLREMT